MSLMDHYLYRDEDLDMLPSEMTDFSPVEAAHVRELVERGLLQSGEVFSHKGWHHVLYHKDDVWWGSMWDGPTGSEQRYIAKHNKWEM